MLRSSSWDCCDPQVKQVWLALPEFNQCAYLTYRVNCTLVGDTHGANAVTNWSSLLSDQP